MLAAQSQFDQHPIMYMFWWMLMFFLFFMWVWIVISIFMDNFRRNDHGGFAKAMWTLFIIFLPVLGVLCYMIARPKNTPQDQEMMAQFKRQQQAAAGISAADELEKLAKLKADGTISEAEFEAAKKGLI